MDHWERRLQLTARSAASGHPATTSPGARARRAAPSTAPLAPSPTRDVTSLIHPDEMPVVQALLELAASRPGFRAELALLTRNRDRWEYHRFEVADEVMGPAIRPVGGATIDLGTLQRRGDDPGPEGSLPAVVHRREVLDHLEAVLRGGDGTVAVLLLDLDRFKLHNDLLGPDGGNALLATMASRVGSVAGERYWAGLGGDEFVVVVDDLDDPDDALELADELRRAIAEPLTMGAERLSVTATVGVAVGRPGARADHLLRDADTAMFAGKDHGRDRAELYGPTLEARTARQLGMAQRLRHALGSGTLELHYQPVLSLQTGQVVAAEALMRIDGHEGTPSSPASLIDAAEDSGLIARLGRYVLEETTSQLAVWEERLNPDRHFRVSVNISPIQLANHDFLDAIRHALRATQVSPARLSLEITGSVLLGVGPTVDSVVRQLDELGVAFGLDDFGTDSSSLGGLRRYPIRFLKIDRELVGAVDRDRKAEAIVASTISLAHNLGMSTIAVGVERPAQRDLLRSLGCDAAQGYLFTPPVDARHFGELF